MRILPISRYPPANGAGRISSVYSAGLAVTAYEFDFFGRVASLKDAALVQYLATDGGRKTAQISLIAGVANTYLALLADDELLAITRQTLNMRQASYKLARMRFDAGVASELDLRSAVPLLEAANTPLAQQTRQRVLSENTLTLLVSQGPGLDLSTKGAARVAFFSRISLTASAGSASSLLAILFQAGMWAVRWRRGFYCPFATQAITGQG